MDWWSYIVKCVNDWIKPNGSSTLANTQRIKTNNNKGDKEMIIVLDAGHGALDPVTGSDKQALTRKYIFPHNGHVVYEGVINRLYTKALKPKLEALGYEVVETAPDHYDTSLSRRVRISNEYKGAYFLAIHCNASESRKATGLEGYTSRRDNKSDKIMESILQEIKKLGIKLRSDMSDGELDKEANYYVLGKHQHNYAGGGR